MQESALFDAPQDGTSTQAAVESLSKLNKKDVEQS